MEIVLASRQVLRFPFKTGQKGSVSDFFAATETEFKRTIWTATMEIKDRCSTMIAVPNKQTNI